MTIQLEDNLKKKKKTRNTLAFVAGFLIGTTFNAPLQAREQIFYNPFFVSNSFEGYTLSEKTKRFSLGDITQNVYTPEESDLKIVTLDYLPASFKKYISLKPQTNHFKLPEDIEKNKIIWCNYK